MLTYWLTCLLTDLLAYLLTYLLAYLLTYLLAYLLTYWLPYLLTWLLTYLLTCLLTDLLTCLLTYLHTYLFTYSLTCLHTWLLSYILTYLLTYLLNYYMGQSPSWQANRFSASQEIPRISRNPTFYYAFTSARNLSLSWASSIHSVPAHPTFWRSILILSSHLRLGLPSCLFPSGFPNKILYTPLLSPITIF